MRYSCVILKDMHFERISIHMKWNDILKHTTLCYTFYLCMYLMLVYYYNSVKDVVESNFHLTKLIYTNIVLCFTYYIRYHLV